MAYLERIESPADPKKPALRVLVWVLFLKIPTHPPFEKGGLGGIFQRGGPERFNLTNALSRTTAIRFSGNSTHSVSRRPQKLSPA